MPITGLTQSGSGVAQSGSGAAQSGSGVVPPSMAIVPHVESTVSDANQFAPLINLSEPPAQDSAPAQDPWTQNTTTAVEEDPWAQSEVPAADPWEVAIRQDNDKKRKGKRQITSSEGETRNSLRIKLNQVVGKKDSAGASSSKATTAKLGHVRLRIPAASQQTQNLHLVLLRG